MAKTVIVVLRCDRCKAEKDEQVDGTESFEFAYDDFSYSLDLCAAHAEDFHNTVQSLISWSSERSRVGTVRRARSTNDSAAPSLEPSMPRRSSSDRDRLKAIREWARQNGHSDLSDRGRIPQRIIAEYEGR